jgi:hypothetical protein
MAEAPKKDRTERSPPQPEESEQQRREASGRAEDLDPREEEGWSQPESSAQKGAVSNDSEED